MKTQLYSVITLLVFVTLIVLPNSFAQDNSPENVVRVIYFLPNDRQSQPNIDTQLDILMKEARKFYADTMESNGFGRKTFRLETDAAGNAVVHHLTGKFNDTYYHNETTSKVLDELDQSFDTSKNIYYIAVDISSESLESPNGTICGTAPGNVGLTPAAGQCFNYWVIAHELGHSFGLSHDRFNYSGFDAMIESFCGAEWLDVHPYFNEGSQTDFNATTTVNMLPPSRAPSSNAIRFSFEVRDADGLHQAQLFIPHLDSVVDCKRLSSKSTTVEFETTYVVSEVTSIWLKVIDVNGNHTEHYFPVDISNFLLPPKKVKIPDANLAAAVRAYTDLPPKAEITTETMVRLTRLYRGPDPPIADITGLEYATNLVALSLYEQNTITDFSALSGLRELRFLELPRTGISDISVLSALTKLQTLYLQDNQITDVTPLASLTNLEYLDLTGNPIKNKKPLLALLRKNPDVKIYLKNYDAPLPVTLSHFRAEHTDTGVVLRWITESELNNAGFYLYRSETKDGAFNIVTPTLIPGAGTTGERNEYTWRDTTAKPNTVYYYQIEDVSHAGVRKPLVTVRLRGLIAAKGKMATQWAALKTRR